MDRERFRTLLVLVEEMKASGLAEVRFETHGAMLFYTGAAN